MSRLISPQKAPLPSLATAEGQYTSDFFPQLWFLIVSLMIFGAYVTWDLRLFARVIALDKSYMASLTMTLVALMSAHCGWHIFQTARRTRSVQRWLAEKSYTEITGSTFVKAYVQDLQSIKHAELDDSDAIVEIHADTVRAPVSLGWFFVDLAVRLGLLGTIIGFILIFASLDKIDIEGGDDLKNLLIAMSGGMGTALYTTLTGLIGASLLSFQYLVLGRQSEQLIGLLLRMRRRLRSDTASGMQS